VVLSACLSQESALINSRSLSWSPRTLSLIELHLLFRWTFHKVFSSIHFSYELIDLGTTTGISAHDRALTARSLANPSISDGRLFTRPGHIFPLRYHEGGVLERPGHTEASVGMYSEAWSLPEHFRSVPSGRTGASCNYMRTRSRSRWPHGSAG
jgi:hypothetical protein